MCLFADDWRYSSPTADCKLKRTGKHELFFLFRFVFVVIHVVLSRANLFNAQIELDTIRVDRLTATRDVDRTAWRAAPVPPPTRRRRRAIATIITIVQAMLVAAQAMAAAQALVAAAQAMVVVVVVVVVVAQATAVQATVVAVAKAVGRAHAIDVVRRKFYILTSVLTRFVFLCNLYLVCPKMIVILQVQQTHCRRATTTGDCADNECFCFSS